MNGMLQERYLAALQAEREAPSRDYLQRLTERHLHRFPFENVGKIHYYLHRSRSGLEWLPDTEEWLDLAEARGLGGNCYILNVRFGELLQSLGFETETIRATEGNEHLANRVTVEGRSYYVDVGYGAPLFEPLDPTEEPRFARRGEEVEITRLEADRYRIDRRAEGKSIVTKTIEWKPAELAGFAPAITHSLRDEDDNPFMRRIIATVFKPGAAYSVINRKLFVKSDESVEVHEYADGEEWLAMMRRVFGFDRELVVQAMDFLGERGVELFPAAR